MSKLNQTSCCGVREYDGLLEFDSVKLCLLDVYEQFYDFNEEKRWSSGAFIMFTCPAYEKRMPKLIKYIEECGIGKCTLAPTVMNPNSHNNLQVMLFAPNHKEFDKWFKKNDIESPYGVGDEVENVAQKSARYGQSAIVESIKEIDGEVEVMVYYGDDKLGCGKLSDYKKVD